MVPLPRSTFGYRSAIQLVLGSWNPCGRRLTTSFSATVYGDQVTTVLLFVIVYHSFAFRFTRLLYKLFSIPTQLVINDTTSLCNKESRWNSELPRPIELPQLCLTKVEQTEK